MFSAPIVVPPPGEYVADGAARQAAWVLSGADRPPIWSAMRTGETQVLDPAPVPAIRAAYAAARSGLYRA
jgi:xylulokinase